VQNKNMPGAFHDDINYVCVTGKFIEVRISATASGVRRPEVRRTQNQQAAAVFTQGKSLWRLSFTTLQGKELLDKEATWTQRITGLGYKQVYGSATVWGDGITPVPVGQLEGATCVELHGVYHSPLGAAHGRPWYGSEEILGQWVNYLQPSSARATR
jgi:hypothetical protein